MLKENVGFTFQLTTNYNKLLFSARKHKKNRLKRLAMPIMTLILLKSMTIIPMAIGILGLKAFNALKLGFLSFVFSVGLAIFQLCKKVRLSLINFQKFHTNSI